MAPAAAEITSCLRSVLEVGYTSIERDLGYAGENVQEMYIKFQSDVTEDIIITGSSANFNYNPTSDIDLHILLDFKKVNCDEK